jgi:hypothetical protein
MEKTVDRCRSFNHPIVAAVLACAALFLLPSGALARSVANAAPAIPGGVYTGSVGHDTRVTIRVDADALIGSIHGTVALGCAPGRATFKSSNGTFVARWRNGSTARGTFDVNRVTGYVNAIHGTKGCGPARYQASLSSPVGVKSKTVRYGPFNAMGMSMGSGMSMSSMNMFNMQGSMQDFFPANIQKPCGNCYIVGMVPDLVYPNGKVANYNTGVMLHHLVVFNTSQRDTTCPSWAQRVFASGNERTDYVLPAGYGYYISPTDRWSMLTELMNMSMKMQTVETQITFYYVPASARLHSVLPLWLDENQCGNSEYKIPAGHSVKRWTYQVPASIAGNIVAIGGHLHDYGTHISLTDTTSGQMICNAKAGYGANMDYMGNIDSMSGCVGTPVARIHAGDTLRLDSFYNSPMAEKGVMGIMVAYVAPHGG